MKYDISKLGIDYLNPMQQEMLQVARRERQLVLLSPTGSGKTLAYLLAARWDAVPPRPPCQRGLNPLWKPPVAANKFAAGGRNSIDLRTKAGQDFYAATVP